MLKLQMEKITDWTEKQKEAKKMAKFPVWRSTVLCFSTENLG